MRSCVAGNYETVVVHSKFKQSSRNSSLRGNAFLDTTDLPLYTGKFTKTKPVCTQYEKDLPTMFSSVNEHDDIEGTGSCELHTTYYKLQLAGYRLQN